MMEQYNIALKKGEVLKGTSYKYLIEQVLGQGSFGITYLASVKMAGALGSIDAGIKVAIKEFFMRDINGRSDSTVTSGSNGGIYDDYRKKFSREAFNLSKLQHPNIIKVIESFEANNTIYYVMEYIGGGSLDDYITMNNCLKEDEAIEIVKQIGSALSFMHDNKMLHLDLKPSNIMRKESGDIVLIDFGLSKQYDEKGEPESSTKVGAGTLGYAPIEQANYREGKDFPVTMDVYALGGTMFKMLTGIRPPEASDILNEGFPVFELKEHGIQDDVIAIISKAMSPLRRDRYQSIGLFTEAFGGIILIDNKSTNYNKQNNTKRYDETIIDKTISEICIKYDQGYIGWYMYELTITSNELSLFIPSVCIESKARSKMPSGLWDTLIEKLSKDLIKKEEIPYNRYEDSETPPSLKISFFNNKKERIDKLYVTGWGADCGNIKDWTPYYLNEKIHNLIPSLSVMEEKLKQSKNVITELPLPDTLHISEYNEQKKYGYSIDISLWRKCMDVKAYPLLKMKSFELIEGQKGEVYEHTIPIDVDNLKSRLYQYRFLENSHWEEDYDDMILPGRGIEISCDFIRDYNGLQTVFYSRNEISMGESPLAIAVHNLLANECEFHHFLSKVCIQKTSGRTSEETDIDLQASNKNYNEKCLSDHLFYNISGVGLKMIRLKKGGFTMGKRGKGYHNPNEPKNPHYVTLSEYYISETPVTQELWEAIMGYNPSMYIGKQNPVECVSWYDCQKFIEKINMKTGQEFRLPTEAEWEYAARGGYPCENLMCSGNNDINPVGWHKGNSDGKTHPVKLKKPNRLGIYDMSGNVNEWCYDWFAEYTKTKANDPKGPSEGVKKVYRGSCYNGWLWDYDVCNRFEGMFPGRKQEDLGFRLAMSNNRY